MTTEVGLDDVRSIPAMLLHRAATEPSSVAVRRQAGGVWWETTWAELASGVEVLGAALLADNASTGDAPIAILGGTTLDSIIAGYAVQAIGAVAMRVGPLVPAGDLPGVIGDATLAFVEDQEQYDRLVESGAAQNIQRIIAFSSRGLTEVDDPRLVLYRTYCAAGRERLDGEPHLVRRAAVALTGEALAVVMPGGSGAPLMASHDHMRDAALRLSAGLDLSPGTPYVHSAESPATMAQYIAVAVAPMLPLVLHLPERGMPVTAAWHDVAPQLVALTPAGWAEIADFAGGSMSRGSLLVRTLYRQARSATSPTADGAGAGRRMLFRALRRQLGLGRVRRALCIGGSPPPELVGFCRHLGIELTELYSPHKVGPVAMRAGGTGTAYTILPSSVARPWEVRSRNGHIEFRATSSPTSDGDHRWIDVGDQGEVIGRQLELAVSPDPGVAGEAGLDAASPTLVEEASR